MTTSFDHLRAAAVRRNISVVRLVIFQGGEARSHVMSVEQLLAFASRLRSGVASGVNAMQLHGKIPADEWERTFLNPEPSSESCAYCAAYGTCSRTMEQAHEAAADPVLAAFIAAGDDGGAEPAPAPEPPPPADADVDTRLAWAMGIVAHLEAWCEAVRAKAHERAMAGNPPPGFGLELGRAGNRKWSDPVEALRVLREQFRLNLEAACNHSVKSPTQLLDWADATEKETGKAPIGPRQRKVIEAMIVRADPKPALKPVSKIKKPWTPPQQAAVSEVFPTEEPLA